MASTIKRRQVVKFVREYILPALPSDYFLHRETMLCRSFGAFVQFFVFDNGRYGNFLMIFPGMLVCGAEPGYKYFHLMLAPRRRKGKDAVIFEEIDQNEEFASRVLEKLENFTTLPLLEELSIDLIDRSLLKALPATQKKNLLSKILGRYRGEATVSPQINAAFWFLLQGSSKAEAILEDALAIMQQSKEIRDGVLPIAMRSQKGRVDRLLLRTKSDGCLEECKAESNKHAEILGLPPINWSNFIDQ